MWCSDNLFNFNLLKYIYLYIVRRNRKCLHIKYTSMDSPECTHTWWARYLMSLDFTRRHSAACGSWTKHRTSLIEARLSQTQTSFRISVCPNQALASERDHYQGAVGMVLLKSKTCCLEQYVCHFWNWKILNDAVELNLHARA